jgi:hypothetical protein
MSFEVILQSIMTAILLATGAAVWRSTVTLARLSAELGAHDKLDEVRFTALALLINKLDEARIAELAASREKA